MDGQSRLFGHIREHYVAGQPVVATPFLVRLQVVCSNKQRRGGVAQPAQPPQPPRPAGPLPVGAVAPPRSGVHQHTVFAGVRIQAVAPSTQDLCSHPGQTIRVLGSVRGGRSDHICVTAEMFAHIWPGQRLTALIDFVLACRPIL